MSMALSLIVYGQVYFLGPTSNVRPNVIGSDDSTAVPAIGRTLNEQKPSQLNRNTISIPAIDRRIGELPSEKTSSDTFYPPIFISQSSFDAPPAASDSTSIPNVALAKRDDYTYTPGIGAHKVHTEASLWSTAWKKCRNEGAHLAIINSHAESKLIAALLGKAGPTISGNFSNYAHMGFHDLFADSEWVTIDGQSLLEAGFTEWEEGEPSHLDGKDEYCGSIRISDGRIKSQNCADHLSSFVCELR